MNTRYRTFISKWIMLGCLFAFVLAGGWRAMTLVAADPAKEETKPDELSGGEKKTEAKSLKFEEVLKAIAQGKLETPRHSYNGDESEVYQLMQQTGRYIPEANDEPKLVKAMNDDKLNLARRLCLAGYLLELNNQAARDFLLEKVNGNDRGVMTDAAHVLLFHVHPEIKYDFATQQVLGLVASDRFFKASGSTYLVEQLSKLKLNVPTVKPDPAAPKPTVELWDAEQELIKAYLRHPEIQDTDMGKVLGQLGTDKAFVALAEKVESRKGFQFMPAYILVKHRRPGIAAILLRHLDNVGAVQLLGDLQERGTLPALRDYLEQNPKAKTAAELRLSIERTAARDVDDLVARLTPMLNDADAVSPGRILELLKETNRSTAVAPIVELVKTSYNQDLVQMGAYALQRIDGKEALQALVKLLDLDISFKEIRDKPTIPFVFNKLIFEILEAKTGQKFGEDKAKWVAYVNEVQERRAELEKAGDKVNGLQAAIRLERTEFKAGEPIKVEWEIRNVSDEKRVIIWHHLNWCPALFDITGPDGKTRSNLWDPTRDVFSEKNPPKPLTLSPGQSHRATFDLNHFWPDMKGEYTVVGVYGPKDVKQLEWYLTNEWIKPEMVVRVASGPLAIKVLTADERGGAKSSPPTPGR